MGVGPRPADDMIEAFVRSFACNRSGHLPIPSTRGPAWAKGDSESWSGHGWHVAELRVFAVSSFVLSIIP